MKNKFPVWCLVLSILFLFCSIASIVSNIVIAIVITPIIFFILCIPIFIAESRNVKNKELVIQLSVLLWFIPFSWLIAMGMALFGRTKR